MKLKITLLASVVLAVSGCGGSENNVPETYSLPVDSDQAVDQTSSSELDDNSTYSSLGVHDPSVVKVMVESVDPDTSETIQTPTYYVFGSHLDAARTSNLMTWEYISEPNGNMDASPLFDVYSTEISEGIEWTDGYIGNWAADVIQSPDGSEFWFYYNHCGQDVSIDDPANFTEPEERCWHRSYLGLATSDNIEGPYENQGIFLRTGQRDGEEEYLPEGVTSYEPVYMPNAIDPAAFYDADGNLWMTYGSYSGGIYILAMDEATGMPEPGQGYGTQLVGGNFQPIEGSFVIYSPESEYYYLFWSSAGFAQGGGYTMRVARSRTPDGPYEDAAGNELIAKWIDPVYAEDGVTVETAGYWVNGASAEGGGTKLLGSVLWESAFGDTSPHWGYNAPGHNSAIYDEELDKYLVFFHSRFPEGEGYGPDPANPQAHNVRIHEMFLTEDDWLVVSPYQFDPTLENIDTVDLNDIPGEYRLIQQGSDSNGDEYASAYVMLSATGRAISGELTGRYKVFDDEPGRIQVVIGDITYEGFYKWQTNVEDQWQASEGDVAPIRLIITAMSADGQTLLAEKLVEQSAAQTVADIRNAFNELYGDGFEITGDQEFPTRGARGATIEWSSSLPYFVRSSGRVIRPAQLEGDMDVTIYATVTLNGVSDSFMADTTLIAMTAPDVNEASSNLLAEYAFEGSLAESNAAHADGIAITDYAGGTTDAAYITGYDGEGQALALDGSYAIRLPTDVINDNSYTISFWLNEQVGVDHAPAVFMARDGGYWTSILPQVWWGAGLAVWGFRSDTDSWYTLTTNYNPAAEWIHVAVTVDSGNTTIYVNGNELAAGTDFEDLFTDGTYVNDFVLGMNYWGEAINGYMDQFRIYDIPLNPAQIAAVEVIGATSALEVAQYAADNLTIDGNLEYVTDTLELAHSDSFGLATLITWESSDESVIDPLWGTVTRPERGADNAVVTLTASVTLDGVSVVTKTFEATVIAQNTPEPIARFAFEGNLTDTVGSFGTGEAADKTADTPLITPAESENIYSNDGVVGMAIEFEGDAGPGAVLPNGLITDHSYTISMWLKPDVLNQFTTTFFGYAASNSWVSVVPFGPGDGSTHLWSGEAWFDGALTEQIPIGEWSHVVFVVSDGAFQAYLNGELLNSLAGFPDVFTPVGDQSKFSLATNLFPWDANFDGLMDELIIYDAPLASEDVANLYANPAGYGSE